MTLVLNRPQGQALKEEGMQLALTFSGEWKDLVLDEFAAWIATQKALGETVVTIESFRSQCKTHPVSHYAWGSLPGMAQRAGLIAPFFVAPGIQGRVRAAAPLTRCHEVKQWQVL